MLKKIFEINNYVRGVDKKSVLCVEIKFDTIKVNILDGYVDFWDLGRLVFSDPRVAPYALKALKMCNKRKNPFKIVRDDVSCQTKEYILLENREGWVIHHNLIKVYDELNEEYNTTVDLIRGKVTLWMQDFADLWAFFLREANAQNKEEGIDIVHSFFQDPLSEESYCKEVRVVEPLEEEGWQFSGFDPESKFDNAWVRCQEDEYFEAQENILFRS